MPDGVPMPVVISLLAALGVTGGGTAYLTDDDLSVAEATIQHNEIKASIAAHKTTVDGLSVRLNCFGRHNAVRAIRYWKSQGVLSHDQEDMYDEQKDLLEYYKDQLRRAGAPPCTL